jgi:uncharacterized hydrophobic protein (TIGR00271 family)
MTEIRYSRRLSLWQVMARGLGVMVILALFVLMGDTVATAGPLAPLVFLLAAVLMLVNTLGYVELATSVPGANAEERHRVGGAYVLVHETEGGWLAFLTGWILILAGLGVCALLAQGFALQVTTLVRDHLGLALPAWPWAAILVILSAANNGLGTQGRRQGQAIILLMVVFLGFTLLAIPQIKLDHYAVTHLNWRQMLPLLMVPFVGVEVVAGLQGEMRRRAKDAPRALLLTPSLASVLVAIITAVTVGVVGAKTLAGSRVPLAWLGSRLVGGAGRPFILVTGAFGLALAFGSALMQVTRQIYTMSKDGYWPTALRRIHPRLGTPIWTIVVVTLVVLPLSALPGDALSRLAGLLYLLVLMSVNIALLRRPQTESAPFTLPFHPWIPGLVLVLDVFVFPLSGVAYLAGVAGCLALGALIYLLYAQDRHVEAKEGVTVFKPPPEERADVAYRILVPIANPATAGMLLRLAGVLARQQNGEVLALQVVTVPDQVPLDEGRHRAASSRVLLEQALTQAQEEDFRLQAMTRVAHNVAEGILDTANEETVDLILLGWRGYTRSAGASMGPIIDPVIRDGPCDVTVVKGAEWDEAKKILVPTSGGPNAPIGARLAWLLSEVYDSQVTALYVQLGRATPERMEENRRLIAKTLEGLEFARPPEHKVIVADSVVDGILREAEDYDLVLLGASEEGLFDQFAFGSIPQQIAARVPRTAVMVKRYGGPTEFWTRKLARALFRVLPRLNIEEQLELREAMRDSARPGVNYFVLITLSAIIASLGLLLDSAAVVIGAMLVAPLMSPIMGFSLGMVLGDVRLIRLSIEAVFKGVALGVIIAVLIGIFSPFKELTGEIMARTQPTLLDLVVAMASGMAGAYALSRKEVGAALPGVAIAAALMPPLGVAGLGLSLGEPQVVGGAFLLFITNIAAISLAGVLVFTVLGVRPQTWRPETRRRMRRSLVGFALLLLVIAIPLGVIMGSIVRDTARQRSIQQVLRNEMAARGRELVEFEHRMEQGEVVVVATVRSTRALDQEAVEDIASALGQQLERPVTLDMVALPVTRAQAP